MSFNLILPFLRPIESLVVDPDISEIMVNADGSVFTERRGRMEACHAKLEEKQLLTAIKTIARQLGDDFGDQKPILDSRLPDGSRVAAVYPPCSVGGVTLTIRKFQTHRWSLAELISSGAIPEDVVSTVQTAIEEHKNILISGGTGTGKTTMLNALASLICPAERLLIIEDTSEIQLTAPNLVRFEARRPQDNVPGISIRDLLKASLRHRPDRIILGEIRGEEAFDLLQALNTGHSGSLSTIHANNATQALSRFSSCVLQARIELPYAAIQGLIADAVDYVLHIERRDGRRYVAELLQVDRWDFGAHTYQTTTLYSHCRRTVAVDPSLSALAGATTAER